MRQTSWLWFPALAVSIALIVLTGAWLQLRQPDVAHAAPPGYPRQWVVAGQLQPMGYHRYIDLSTSVDLTDRGTFTIPPRAHLVLLHVEGANVRWRDFPHTLGDTTDPTATVGMPIYAGDGLYPYDGWLHWIEFIEMSQGAILHASFYGM